MPSAAMARFCAPALAWALFALAIVASPRAVAASAGVRYAVRVDTSADPSFEIEAEFPTDGRQPLQVSLPVSRPGNPRLKNFSRLVARLEAKEGAQRLLVRRIDPNTWEVRPRRRGAVTLRYRANLDRADTLRLGSSWIDREGAYVDGAAVFLFSVRHRDSPVHVKVTPPLGWKVATSLAPEGEGRFGAPSYDRLVDAPIVLGPGLSERPVETGCARFRLVFDRELPAYDAAAFDQNLRRIADAAAHLFGSCPFHEYTVFARWRPDLEFGGGLEHGDSMTLNVGRQWMEDLPREAAGTLAHELFHAWNGEAIRAACDARWDYRRANPCAELWFVEGVSSYYAVVLLARTGIWSEEQFLRSVAGDLACNDGPAVEQASLKDAAVAQWVRPVENRDYYCGGALVAFLLDVELRARTRGRRSLDDAMRALYAESRRPGYRGFSEDDLVRAIEGGTGAGIEPLFDAWVRKPGRWDYAPPLHQAGLEAVVNEVEDGSRRASVRRATVGDVASARVLDEILGREAAARGVTR